MINTTIKHLALALLLGIVSIQAASTGWESPGKGRCKIDVKPPQTIQSAIDVAKPGDSICIPPGRYSEQLLITKNGISLIGSKGAILTPPATFSTNLCSSLVSGAQAGICIAGADVVFGDCKFPEKCKVKSVGRPIKNVSVQGLEISGFGENIAIVGADKTEISGNTLIDGAFYGAVSVGSRDTKTRNNIVKTTKELAFIAICTDNFNGVETRDNQITGYNIGLCVQTSGSIQEKNTITGCCAGAVVDPKVTDAKVRRNKIGPIDSRCATTFPLNGGIYMVGSIGAKIEDNIITGYLTGKAPGVGILDGEDGSLAVDNLINGNTISNNDVDIFIQTNGTGNRAVNNRCLTSVPFDLCANR